MEQPSNVVWDAVSGNDINQLIVALTTHSNLVDTAMSIQDKKTPMSCAAQLGNELAIETLFRFGSLAIDSPSCIGWTPMHYACWCGHVGTVEMLVRLGSQAMNLVDGFGWTPDRVAEINNKPAAKKVLQALSANPGIEVTEDEVFEARYRVYFSSSFVHRLLLEIDRLTHTRASASQRRSQ